MNLDKCNQVALNVHPMENASLLENLKGSGCRITRTRRAMLDILSTSRVLLSADDLRRALAVKGLKVNKTTVYRELSWQGFRHILRESIGITAMIFLIIPAAMTFGLYLTSEKIPQSIVQWVTSYNLSAGMFWLATQIMFFVMGTFLEAVSIILITVPILFPLLKVVGIDPIHFAVIMVINMELAMITPPVGLNLFVVSGIAKAKLEQVVKGVMPFIIIMVACMILLILFPKISLLLPGMMKN
ncbi:MAG: Sialic acid TRAP transporter permease protein SiaT [Syntrophaceae bacterium PtaU1.Bin231]|nr:MAG: Sialic acid TRAP transporter permease protein SiaT [Syntrophaceae bacterium PtaU1.Bin231]